MYNQRDKAFFIITENISYQVAWRGFAFEGVCFNHVSQIKQAHGIVGVNASYSAWSKRENDTDGKRRINMNELYKLIEEKIKASGYPEAIDGREFYNDVSDEADEKENGTYVFLIKKTDELMYKGCMTIIDEEFDLHYVDILVGESSYHVDFDA